MYYLYVCIVYYCVCNIGLFAQFKGKISATFTIVML